MGGFSQALCFESGLLSVLSLCEGQAYLVCVLKAFCVLLNSTLAKAVFCYPLFLVVPSKGAGAFDSVVGGERLERGVHAGCYQHLT